VAVPIERRIAIWDRLASDLRPPHLDEAIAHEISLEDAPDALTRIVRGEIQGRTVVRVAS
jgi:acrylyl-CoA reductase (NADPH)